MTIKKLSIVIPVYNEEKTMQAILNKVVEVSLVNSLEKEIIIVNDASTDGTEKAITDYIAHHPQLDIRYYVHGANRGKGAALRTGFSRVTGDYVIVQDADLECDPNEYNILLDPVMNRGADVVYGSRFVGGNPRRILFFWNTIINRFLTFFSNVFTNLNLTDMETGYKLFRADIIRNLSLKEDRFGFEPEVTAKISKIRDLRLYEVSISYHGRTSKEGKKIRWKDGVRALYCIVKYNLF